VRFFLVYKYAKQFRCKKGSLNLFDSTLENSMSKYAFILLILKNSINLKVNVNIGIAAMNEHVIAIFKIAEQKKIIFFP
jgi:hypothetical protein